ncbi:hypothetical protein KFL_006550030 [Klebsormidium nitens]|uniref:VWFA domain-containing protein n=1 Tax=Klebsormidium nitens TaxID=105231 RepID=A0A1Y1IIM7_KLENI|nr:hypothetical protein KFL_006550030 [Klebsormidium nitens]|eukprot:GAQ90553.1 hypothetical protein KFL_006550030 [Klebsormidium nitens]
MHFTLTASFVVVFLSAAWPGARSQASGSSIANVMAQKEQIAVQGAISAAVNEENACAAIAACGSNVSALACTLAPVSSMTTACFNIGQGSQPACNNATCSNLLFSYEQSNIRLPNGVGVKKAPAPNPGAVNARLRTNYLQRDICVQKPLDNRYKTVVPQPLASDFPDFAFYGSASGVMRIFPAVAYDQFALADGSGVQCTPSYDPRRRPWFAGAASQTKLLVLLLDLGPFVNSPVAFGTAAGVTKLAAMQATVSALFESLRAFDVVAVVTVSNSTGPQVLTTAYGQFAQVTTFNVPRVNRGDEAIMALDAAVQNLTAATSGTTDLLTGLTQALTVADFELDLGKTICERVVLVLTDGLSLGNTTAAGLTAAVQAQQLRRKETTVLFFSVGAIGRSAQSDALLQQVSCATGSVWGKLDDFQNALLSMYPYFNLLAARSFYNPGVSNLTYFTQRYTSASRRVDVISPARPVYDGSGNLVGVASGDFSLQSTLLRNFTLEEVDAELNSRITLERCSNVSLSECRLETIRQFSGYTCGTGSGCPALVVSPCSIATPPSTNSSVAVLQPPQSSPISDLLCCGTCALNAAPPPAPTAAPGNGTGGGGSPTGAIVGGSVGGLVVIIIVIVVVYCCCCRKAQPGGNSRQQVPLQTDGNTQNGAAAAEVLGTSWGPRPVIDVDEEDMMNPGRHQGARPT